MSIMERNIYKETAERLIDVYGFSTRYINILAEERNMSSLVSVLDLSMSNVEKLELMLRLEGSEFFAGSDSRELRKRIIDKWDSEVRDSVFEQRCNSNGKSDSHKSRKLSELNWHIGGGWSRQFMDISGFDSLFCGRKIKSMSVSDYEDVEPYKKLPDLVDYQIGIKEELQKALSEQGDDAKCLISLPTGAGKTRVAVEAYTDFLRPRFFEGKYLIWIAQSEELCEQSIATFKQIWQHKEFSESLRIYRLFGNHKLDAESMIGGIVVCSINKLYNAIKKGENEAIRLLIENCGAVIIDEAHRAVTSMYELFYKYSSQIRGEKMFPICGLSATPGRTDDINRLIKLFRFQLVTPQIPCKYDNHPISYFREKRFLACPIHEIITTGTTYTINVEPGKPMPSLEELEFEVSKKACKKLALDIQRNKKIMQKLMSLKNEATIVYSCKVDHATFLASALLVNGVSAAAVTSQTPKHLRLDYIEKFRNGELKVLVNHSVLATGFDAPRTNNIVITRPIFSDILYEQIVGRGLRGPKFGGTETCRIVDFTDNLGRFGDQQSYHRFESFWV